VGRSKHPGAEDISPIQDMVAESWRSLIRKAGEVPS
jgi:hypothetical protein